MSNKKFYKTFFTVTVLSEEPPKDMSMGELAYECMEGVLSGAIKMGSQIIMDGKQAAEALKEQGSDPEFFHLDEEGNDLND